MAGPLGKHEGVMIIRNALSAGCGAFKGFA
jgi:hypothetical protein